jgi:hypothetical protein
MDSFKHNVPTAGAGQATFEQCWLASFQMMYKFKGLNANSIEDKLNGAGIKVDDAKANGLIDKDYAKAATALGLTSLSSAPFKDTSIFDFDVSSGAKDFLKELQKGPIWVSRFVGSGYHAVVATGYNDGGTGYIIHNNPFPGPTNAIEVTTLTATVFCRHITNALGSVQAFR